MSLTHELIDADIYVLPWRPRVTSDRFAVSRELVCADFSQIESRVLAWLAGQQDILDVFASGADVYTYDAKNVGSNNRQLGKVLRLGLGFGMGPVKFVDAAAMYGVTLAEDEARVIVKAWREANNHTVRFWYALDDAFRRAINAAPGSKFPVGYITIERGTDAIGIKLPSGRRLIYRNPRLEIEPEKKVWKKRDDGTWAEGFGTSIVYDGVQQYSKKWGAVRTYGGKLAENVTQAVARDVMAAAMLILDAKSVDLRLTVHDEIIAIALAETAAATLALVLEVMRTPPPWASGLPVGAEGWRGKRYRKG